MHYTALQGLNTFHVCELSNIQIRHFRNNRKGEVWGTGIIIQIKSCVGLWFAFSFSLWFFSFGPAGGEGTAPLTGPGEGIDPVDPPLWPPLVAGFLLLTFTLMQKNIFSQNFTCGGCSKLFSKLSGIAQIIILGISLSLAYFWLRFDRDCYLALILRLSSLYPWWSSCQMITFITMIFALLPNGQRK